MYWSPLPAREEVFFFEVRFEIGMRNKSHFFRKPKLGSQTTQTLLSHDTITTSPNKITLIIKIQNYV